MQVNVNPLWTNITRAAEDNGTFFGYQWQVKYRWQQALEFGVVHEQAALGVKDGQTAGQMSDDLANKRAGRAARRPRSA